MYELTRGSIGAWSSGDYGACVSGTVPTEQFDDADLPAAGSGYFYMLRGATSLGVKGPLGSDSAGVDRVNANASDCS